MRAWLLMCLACLLPAGCQDGPAPAATPVGSAQRVAIAASKEGFSPAEVHFEQGRRAILEITRTDDSRCADAVRMPWREQPYELPQNTKVEIEIPDTSKAGSFGYACWMNMLHGRVVIDPHP